MILHEYAGCGQSMTGIVFLSFISTLFGFGMFGLPILGILAFVNGTGVFDCLLGTLLLSGTVGLWLLVRHVSEGQMRSFLFYLGAFTALFAGTIILPIIGILLTVLGTSVIEGALSIACFILCAVSWYFTDAVKEMTHDMP